MEGRPNPIWAWCGIVLGTLYVLNPGAGIFEFIPDVVPVIGNLDDAGATLLVIQSIRSLRRGRKDKPALAADQRTRVEP
jgi:uncharacterized membrane protein YkvA (DUF1232 family)